MRFGRTTCPPAPTTCHRYYWAGLGSGWFQIMLGTQPRRSSSNRPEQAPVGGSDNPRRARSRRLAAPLPPTNLKAPTIVFLTASNERRLKAGKPGRKRELPSLSALLGDPNASRTTSGAASGVDVRSSRGRRRHSGRSWLVASSQLPKRPRRLFTPTLATDDRTNHRAYRRLHRPRGVAAQLFRLHQEGCREAGRNILRWSLVSAGTPVTSALLWSTDVVPPARVPRSALP